MKSTPLVVLNDEAISLIIKSMKSYKSFLQGEERDKFSKEVVRIVKYGREVELDKISIKWISKALKRRSELLFVHIPTRKGEERKKIIELAFYLDFELINKEQKTSTGATVNAS